MDCYLYKLLLRWTISSKSKREYSIEKDLSEPLSRAADYLIKNEEQMSLSI